MDFNSKAYCDLDFHYFHCAIPEDMVDVEMTICMVEGIHTYRRLDNPDKCLQSLGQTGKALFLPPQEDSKFEEEKRRSQENKSSNPFTPVMEEKSGHKRSRKYRKLCMGCSIPSTVASVHPTTITTTSMAILSTSIPTSLPAPIPSGPPSTSNTLLTPKLQMQSPLSGHG